MFCVIAKKKKTYPEPYSLPNNRLFVVFLWRSTHMDVSIHSSESFLFCKFLERLPCSFQSLRDFPGNQAASRERNSQKWRKQIRWCLGQCSPARFWKRQNKHYIIKGLGGTWGLLCWFSYSYTGKIAPRQRDQSSVWSGWWMAINGEPIEGIIGKG